MPDGVIIALIVVITAVLLFYLTIFFVWYKKCPPDKIMVIYGKIARKADGTQPAAKCIHGGAAFIVPVFQSYAFLDVNPIAFEFDLPDLLTSDGGAELSGRLNFAISTEPELMQNAAERLLGLATEQIKMLASDIFAGEVKQYFEAHSTEDLKNARGRLAEDICKLIGANYKLLGLRIINMNFNKLKLDY